MLRIAGPQRGGPPGFQAIQFSLTLSREAIGRARSTGAKHSASRSLLCFTGLPSPRKRRESGDPGRAAEPAALGFCFRGSGGREQSMILFDRNPPSAALASAREPLPRTALAGVTTAPRSGNFAPRSGDVAAFVAETVVGATAGCVPAMPGGSRRFPEIYYRYRMLPILDEIHRSTPPSPRSTATANEAARALSLDRLGEFRGQMIGEDANRRQRPRR